MLFLSSLSFFALGVALVLFGTNKAELASDLALDLAQSGFLGASLALGLGGGVMIGGPLYDRLPRKQLFVVSAALTGVALLAAAPDASYGRIVCVVLLAGICCGIYETIVNAVIAERFSGGATRAMAFVHASATAGAAVGPLLMRLNPLGKGWPAAFHGLGYLHLGIAVVGLFSAFPAAHSGQVTRPAARVGWRSGGLAALGCVAFAYVGVENGLTVFAVPWAQSRGAEAGVGQAGISALWLGLLCGRLLLAAQRPSAHAAPQLLAAGGVLAGVIVGVASQFDGVPLPWATLLTGIVLGPVFPLMMSLTAQRFPHALGTTMGLVAGAGAAGGFCVPWLAGVVADTASVRVTIGGLGVLGLAIGAAAWMLRPTRASASAA